MSVYKIQHNRVYETVISILLIFAKFRITTSEVSQFFVTPVKLVFLDMSSFCNQRFIYVNSPTQNHPPPPCDSQPPLNSPIHKRATRTQTKKKTPPYQRNRTPELFPISTLCPPRGHQPVFTLATETPDLPPRAHHSLSPHLLKDATGCTSTCKYLQADLHAG